MEKPFQAQLAPVTMRARLAWLSRDLPALPVGSTCSPKYGGNDSVPCVGGKDRAVGGFKVLSSLLNSGWVSQRNKETREIRLAWVEFCVWGQP